MGLLFCKEANITKTAVHGRILQEGSGHHLQLLLYIRKIRHELPEHGSIHILALSADFIYGKYYPAACGCFKHIQNLFPDFPGLHEKTLKTKSICEKAQPEQMAVDS